MSKPRNPRVVMCLIGGTEQKSMSAYIPAPPPTHLLVVIPQVASNVSAVAPRQPSPKAVEAAGPRAAEAETGNVIHSVTGALVNLMPTALKAKGTGSGTARSVRSTSPKEGPRSSVLKKLLHARVAAPMYPRFPQSVQPPTREQYKAKREETSHMNSIVVAELQDARRQAARLASANRSYKGAMANHPALSPSAMPTRSTSSTLPKKPSGTGCRQTSRVVSSISRPRWLRLSAASSQPVPHRLKP
jgi:hypothetical protein